jgi:hypothetical protein
MYALKLSFVLRYQMDVLRSVVIPMEKLSDINLAGDGIVDAALAAIYEDDDLMRELFGGDLHDYRNMAVRADNYWKDLMRFQEELVLVPVEA